MRPAGSYVMGRLELRRVSAYPAVNATDIVVLVGTFRIPTGLRSAEAALSSQQVSFLLIVSTAVLSGEIKVAYPRILILVPGGSCGSAEGSGFSHGEGTVCCGVLGGRGLGHGYRSRESRM